MQRHLLGWINRGMVEKARQDLETNIRQIRVDDRGEAYMSHRENQEASVSSYVYTGSSGDVFVVRTSKPVENLWKNGLFWSRHFRKLLEVARFSLRDVTMAKIIRTNKLRSSPPPLVDSWSWQSFVNLRSGSIFFRFVNNTPAGKAKRKQNLIQTF